MRISWIPVWASLALAGLLCSLSWVAWAQVPGRGRPMGAPTLANSATANKAEEQAIRTASDDYCDAFSKGDVAKLMTFWTSDAEYLDGEGETFRGREDIKGYFTDQLAELDGATLKVTITNLRFLRPDVALEDGVADLVSTHGENWGGRYNAVWVKVNGRWLLSRVQDLPTEEDSAQGHAEYLKPLEWLVGEWTHEDPTTGLAESMDCSWSLNKNFLMITEEVSVQGRDAYTVERIVGWDPESKQLKAWFFDSHGGFGEGAWTNSGRVWTAKYRGLVGDGRSGTATTSIEAQNGNSFVWRSQARKIGELAVPGAERKFTRATGGTP